MIDYSKIFTEFLDSREDFRRAWDLVAKNCAGKVWLTGGIVYQGLANRIRSFPVNCRSIDFLADETSQHPNFPREFEQISGSDKRRIIKNGNLKFTLRALPEDSYLKKSGKPADIEGYLESVPLNVQSVVYDIYDRQIIGQTGIEALTSKVVAVNNLEVAIKVGEIKRKIKEKAENLGFRPEYPDKREVARLANKLFNKV